MSKREILRYLGHKGQEVSPELDSLIDETAALCSRTARPRHVWSVFDCSACPEGIRLEPGGLVLPGQGIARHLAGAPKAALLAVTLGVEVDQMVKQLGYQEMTQAVILNAAATQYVEEVCDAAQAEIADRAAGEGLFIRHGRYSPGYGDLPLGLQPDLLRLLDADRKLGVTCTAEHVMIPSKSVTAIIALSPSCDERDHNNKCESCNLKDTCQYGGTPGG